MDSIRNLTWRNINASRNYPFSDSSTLSFDEGFLPQDWIVDGRVYARNQYLEQACPYVSKLTRTSAQVALQVSSGSGQLLGEAVVP